MLNSVLSLYFIAIHRMSLLLFYEHYVLVHILGLNRLRKQHDVKKSERYPAERMTTCIMSYLFKLVVCVDEKYLVHVAKFKCMYFTTRK